MTTKQNPAACDGPAFHRFGLAAERSKNIHTRRQFQEYVLGTDPGQARKGDTLVPCWNGHLALFGLVGWVAKHTVIEKDTVWRSGTGGARSRKAICRPTAAARTGQVAAAPQVAQTPCEPSLVSSGGGATEAEDGPEGAR
jgi:hypothetical protein